jgi:hypothetical protein
MSKSNNEGGMDHSTHHLLEFREIPENLTALRDELLLHPNISNYAQQGKTFEECLARIGVQVDIALDGDYDVNSICSVLCTALRNKRLGLTDPGYTEISGLIEAELVEREGEIQLVDVEAERREAAKQAEVGAPKILLS